jgi:hypothetical protein
MSEPDEQERVIPDEQRARELLEQLKSVHAVDIARDMAIAAVNFSYPKLGLSDETRAVRDLNDVRVSIELIRAVLEVLDREHGGETTSDLHDTLAQMQLAYAHAVQLANAERAAQHTPGEEAPPSPGGEPPAAGRDEPETEPDEGQATAVDEAPAAAEDEEPATRRKPATRKPATKRKPAPKKKPAARRKPAAKKKPAGDS